MLTAKIKKRKKALKAREKKGSNFGGLEEEKNETAGILNRRRSEKGP